MPDWKWRVNEGKELEKILFEYLKSCRQMKADILQAVEAFYLPYALKYRGASPLEIRKAYQKSIDTLQSRVKIMALDAGMSAEAIPQSGGFANEHIESEINFDRVSTASADRHQLDKDAVNDVDKVDDDLPINPLRKISKLEK
jgi:hypothetical protein